MDDFIGKSVQCVAHFMKSLCVRIKSQTVDLINESEILDKLCYRH